MKQRAVLNLSRRAALVGVAASSVASVRAESPGYPGLALGRPHTDFVQSQVAPSRVLTEINSQPGVDGATVSYDAKGTRAVTVIFRYPKGWTFERAHYVNSDEEFYVLDGSVTFDGVTYMPGDYAYLPAGHPHEHMESKDGAVLLNFYEGEHKAFYEPTPPGMYKPASLIKHRAGAAMSWAAGMAEDVAAWGKSAKRKLLRNDPASGESTWLLKVGPDAPTTRRRIATHTAVEEIFLLDGQIATPRGVMLPGAYAWRAPGTPLGPLGTPTGFVALYRSKGGAPKSTYSKAPEPVIWNAAYEPLLADAQKAWASTPYDRNRRF